MIFQTARGLMLLSLQLFVLFSCPILAQDVPTKLSDEVKSFEKELKAAEEEHAARLAALKTKHLDSLQKLRTEATQNNDLDSAVAIRERTDKILKEDSLGVDKKFDQPAARAKLVSALSRAVWLTGGTDWEWSKPGFYFHPSGVMYPWGSDADLNDPKLVRWAPIGPKTIVMIHAEGYVDVLEFSNNITEFRMLRAGRTSDKPDPKWASIRRKLVDPPKSAK